MVSVKNISVSFYVIFCFLLDIDQIESNQIKSNQIKSTLLSLNRKFKCGAIQQIGVKNSTNHIVRKHLKLISLNSYE
jgi:hypothetical protein